MKATRELLLTYDYEPFLGIKSGSAEKCALEPTEALRAVMNRYRAKAIFFVDTLYLLNLKKQPEFEKSFLAIAKQLKEMHNEGHYIFPHIHPHWLDAAYIAGKRTF